MIDSHQRVPSICTQDSTVVEDNVVVVVVVAAAADANTHYVWLAAAVEAARALLVQDHPRGFADNIY